MAGIGVIVNPHARGNRRRPHRVARFETIVGDDGRVVATADLDAMERTLREFRAAGIDILAVCGGDGSMYHVVSCALEVWEDQSLPLLLPLRGGTINNLSRSLGARRRRAESMLAHVVKDYRRGRTHDTVDGDLIRVNGGKYGHIVGTGMIVHFLRLYYSGRRPGPVSAMWLLVRLGLSYFLGTSLIGGVVRPFEADVTCDGERLPHRSFTLLIASTVAHIGLGVRPFYLTTRKRGHFHLLAGSSTPGQLLSRLPRFARGVPANLETLYDNLGAHVRIEFAEPQPFTINGEVLAEPADVLELGPGPRVSYVRG